VVEKILESSFRLCGFISLFVKVSPQMTHNIIDALLLPHLENPN
jgi:hypothetical protein